MIYGNLAGIILHTTKGVTRGGEAENFHTVFLRKGKVVYETKAGASHEELESKWPIRVGKWTKIRIKNNENERTLTVNSDEPVVKAVAYPREVTFSSKPSGKVHLGGNPDNKEDSKFAGTISRIIVNQNQVDLHPPRIVSSLPKEGDSGVIVGIQGNVEQSDECGKEPCQNGGVCITANVHEGFRCECSDFFHGAYCQFKTRFCKSGESCAYGFCVEEYKSSRCVCPLDREGLLCEKPIHPKEKFDGSYKFNGKSSFVAIPPPQSVKNFSLGMTVQLQDSGDQVLAYLGSNYNQKSSEYMAVVIKDGRFVNIYQNGGGKSVVESLLELEPKKKYKIEVSRTGHIAEIKVNGQKSSTRVKTVAFPSGTSIFLGGFPPGMTPRSPITQYKYLQGCITGVELDEARVDIDGMDGILSGDLETCEVDFRGDEVKIDENHHGPNSGLEKVEEIEQAPESDSGENEVKLEEKNSEQDSRGDEVKLDEKLKESDSRGDEVKIQGKDKESHPDEITVVQPSLLPATTEKPPPVKLEDHEDKNSLEAVPEEDVKSGGTWGSEEETNEVTVKPTEIVQKVEEEENKELEIITTPPEKYEESEPVTVAPVEEEKSKIPVAGKVDFENIAPRAKCEPGTCGEHGDCEVVNTTHVVCQCKDYYDGPNCENFKPIEHAARFEGNAYIVFSADEFPHLTSEREESIAFRLKTTAKYGVIFWQGQQEGSTVTGEDYISIGLNDGYLVYRQVLVLIHLLIFTIMLLAMN